MDTKRCPRCNKLLRANTENCNRCGTAIPSSKGTRKLATNWSDSSQMPSQPTNPLASPHRAGHYSGFHPEDQPFQSSFFLRVQRPPTPVPASLAQDTHRDSENNLPVSGIASLTEAPEASTSDQDQSEFVDLPTLTSIPVPALPETSIFEQDPSEFAELSTLYPTANIPTLTRPKARKSRIQVIPLLITASLLSFLVASSLLTFLFLGKSPVHSAGPQLLAMPSQLRVGDELQLSGNNFHAHSRVTLVRDGQTALLDAQNKPLEVLSDDLGNFQAHVPITDTWHIGIHILHATDTTQNGSSASITVQAPVAGPPQLRLGMTHLDLGAGNPGSISHTNMTLTNAGGGQVSWQATSNVNWLSLNPTSGTFGGSMLVVLTVNRSNLAPQTYLGQIIFTQSQAAPQTLDISMTVNTNPANLSVSTASLDFTGTANQSPASQTLVIQNSGGRALNWTAGIETSDSFNWLSITPASGRLDVNTSAVLTVNVNTLKMPPGSYQGTLNFSYAGGPAQQVAVTLTVAVPQPIIQVAPTSLSFTTKQGYNPAPQSIALSNTGDATLNWTIQKDLNGQLYLRVSPMTGSLAPSQSINITVTPILGSASGPIDSTLTIADSDQDTSVASQQVQITIAITDEPVITLVTRDQEFDHSSTTTDTSTLVIFTNTGNLQLNWALTTSTPAPWLFFSARSGTLNPGDYGFITIRCISTQLKPGTYTVTITLQDTDPNTVVAPQTFTVTLKVST
jgi:hypothetical protein